MTDEDKKLWDKMEVVSLSIVCRKGDGEGIAEQMLDSDISQRGIYSMGTEVREAKSSEAQEVITMTPAEILDNYFE
jgi:hypothetical protein